MISQKHTRSSQLFDSLMGYTSGPPARSTPGPAGRGRRRARLLRAGNAGCLRLGAAPGAPPESCEAPRAAPRQTWERGTSPAPQLGGTGAGRDPRPWKRLPLPSAPRSPSSRRRGSRSLPPGSESSVFSGTYPSLGPCPAAGSCPPPGAGRGGPGGGFSPSLAPRPGQRGHLCPPVPVAAETAASRNGAPRAVRAVRASAPQGDPGQKPPASTAPREHPSAASRCPPLKVTSARGSPEGAPPGVAAP